MKIKNNWIFLFLSVLLYLILACPHKNPMPVADLEYFFPPKFVHQSVKIPEPLRQSSDSMAQVVVQYINLFNESEQYLTYLNPPDSILLESSIEPMWNYKWTALEGYYVFLKVEIYPDYSHGWEVKFWGTDTTTGKYYNNWVFLGALQPADKTEGMLSLNYYDDDTILSWYSWKITGDTLKSIYLKTTKDESQVFLDLEIHVCSDLSGELTKRIKISETGFYSREREGIIEYKFSWNANGKGQWWKYDAEGKVIDSGLW